MFNRGICNELCFKKNAFGPQILIKFGFGQFAELDIMQYEL